MISNSTIGNKGAIKGLNVFVNLDLPYSCGNNSIMIYKGCLIEVDDNNIY
jgi:hypothetical protein